MLRLEAVLQVAPDDENTKIISAASFVAISLSCILFLIIPLLFFVPIPFFKSKNIFDRCLIAFSVLFGSFLLSVFNLGRQLSAKQTTFKRIAACRLFRTIAAIGVQYSAAFFGMGLSGLLVGFLCGTGLACLILWCDHKTGFRILDFKKNLRNLQWVTSKYKSFVIADTLNVMISAFSLAAYPILILWQYGNSEAGIYSLASRLVFLPLDVIAAAIATVYFQRISTAVRENSGVTTLFLRTVSLASSLAVFLAIVCCVLGPRLIELFLSERWQSASALLVWLTPSFIVQFVVCVLSSTALALKLAYLQTAWNICQVLVIGCAVFLASRAGVNEFLLFSGLGLLLCGVAYTTTLFFAIKFVLKGEGITAIEGIAT